MQHGEQQRVPGPLRSYTFDVAARNPEACASSGLPYCVSAIESMGRVGGGEEQQLTTAWQVPMLEHAAGHGASTSSTGRGQVQVEHAGSTSCGRGHSAPCSVPVSPFSSLTAGVGAALAAGGALPGGVHHPLGGLKATGGGPCAKSAFSTAFSSFAAQSSSPRANASGSGGGGSGHGGPPHGIKAVCGKRTQMEDAYCVHTNFFELPACGGDAPTGTKLPPRIAQEGAVALSACCASAAHGPAAAAGASASWHGGMGATPASMAATQASHEAYDSLSFFGVFDGHGGFEAAHHCANRLHHHLSEALSQLSVGFFNLGIAQRGGGSSGGGAGASAQPAGVADASGSPVPGPMTQSDARPAAQRTETLSDWMQLSSGEAVGAAPPNACDAAADMSTGGSNGSGGSAGSALDTVPPHHEYGACHGNGHGDALLKACCGSDDSTATTAPAALDRDTGSADTVDYKQGDDLSWVSCAVEDALHDAFLKTDEEFATDESAAITGSTAVVALIGRRRCWIANCGDSRAVLCRGGRAVQLTDDHKPERADEAARVEKAGGHVLFWNGHRVMGVLAMSRAIGDHGLRPYIIPEPEVSVLTRAPEDEFLLLASDGLWDVMSNQETADLAARCLARAVEKGAGRKAAVRIAASVLTKAAIDRGSKDNVTVVIVDLREPSTEPRRPDQSAAGAPRAAAAAPLAKSPLGTMSSVFGGGSAPAMASVFGSGSAMAPAMAPPRMPVVPQQMPVVPQQVVPPDAMGDSYARMAIRGGGLRRGFAANDIVLVEEKVIGLAGRVDDVEGAMRHVDVQIGALESQQVASHTSKAADAFTMAAVTDRLLKLEKLVVEGVQAERRQHAEALDALELKVARLERIVAVQGALREEAVAREIASRFDLLEREMRARLLVAAGDLTGAGQACSSISHGGHSSVSGGGGGSVGSLSERVSLAAAQQLDERLLNFERLLQASMAALEGTAPGPGPGSAFAGAQQQSGSGGGGGGSGGGGAAAQALGERLGHEYVSRGALKGVVRQLGAVSDVHACVQLAVSQLQTVCPELNTLILKGAEGGSGFRPQDAQAAGLLVKHAERLARSVAAQLGRVTNLPEALCSTMDAGAPGSCHEDGSGAGVAGGAALMGGQGQGMFVDVLRTSISKMLKDTRSSIDQLSAELRAARTVPRLVTRTPGRPAPSLSAAGVTDAQKPPRRVTFNLADDDGLQRDQPWGSVEGELACGGGGDDINMLEAMAAQFSTMDDDTQMPEAAFEAAEEAEGGHMQDEDAHPASQAASQEAPPADVEAANAVEPVVAEVQEADDAPGPAAAVEAAAVEPAQEAQDAQAQAAAPRPRPAGPPPKRPRGLTMKPLLPVDATTAAKPAAAAMPVTKPTAVAKPVTKPAPAAKPATVAKPAAAAAKPTAAAKPAAAAEPGTVAKPAAAAAAAAAAAKLGAVTKPATKPAAAAKSAAAAKPSAKPVAPKPDAAVDNDAAAAADDDGITDAAAAAPAVDDGTAAAPVTKPPAKPRSVVAKPAAKPGTVAKPGAVAKPTAAAKIKPAAKVKKDPSDKKPHSKSAYNFFCEANRKTVKDDLPEGANGFKEINSKLGELWHDTAADEKAKFTAAAEEDKAGKVNLVAEWIASHPEGAASKKERKAAKAAKKERKSAKKERGSDEPKLRRPLGAAALFTKAQRVSVKEQNPGVDAAQLKELLSAAWEELDADGKAPFEEEAKALREAELARMTALLEEGGEVSEGEMQGGGSGSEGDGEGSGAPPKAKKSHRKRKAVVEAEEGSGEDSKAPAPKKMRGRKGDKGAKPSAAAAGTSAGAADDSDDEEWGWEEGETAGVIVSHSLDGGHLVVTCNGKALDDVGQVDARAVKAQRANGPDPACPVSLEQLHEYEAFQKRFAAEMVDRMHPRNGVLDLDDLPPGSALESCFLLGKLQEPNQLLSKADPKSRAFGVPDRMIRVPAVALSFVTQRLLETERAKMAVVQEKLSSAKALLQANGILDMEE
ncbi:hypothetical protein FOA52_008085 [Chlamydomonas sp. UWO 241]|nr:hypothetical protein FOA52_008085 [Chlamydomonas sp. UWO 241]